MGKKKTKVCLLNMLLFIVIITTFVLEVGLRGKEREVAG
jgi:hypothetical protein